MHFKIKAKQSINSPTDKTIELSSDDKVYFMGVCGTAMASLAVYLKQAGFQVSGSDQNIYYPMSLLLEQNNIHANKYDSKNLSSDIKLVIVGNVIQKTNPEIFALENLKIPYISFAEFLEETVLKNKENIVVAGTHGKSTTTSLMIQAAQGAGEDSSFFVGALTKNFKHSLQVTDSKYFILEGDEYDTAFFAKHPKFYHYNPSFLILTSLEFDHGDIYKDLEEVKSVFKNLIKKMSSKSHIFACSENTHLKELKNISNSKFLTYGFKDEDDYQIKNRALDNKSQSFDIHFKSEKIISCKISLIGKHNALNVLSVIALSHSLNWDLDKVAQSLADFQGVERRLQKIGDYKQASLYEDFAHHPTAVKASISALKEIFPNRRLVAIFEPRSFTSRLNTFQKQYGESFDNADVAIISKPFDNTRIDEDKRFSSEKLVQDLKSKNIQSFCEKDAKSIQKRCLSLLEKDDVILVMSNGSFSGLLSDLKESLKKL